MAFLFACLDCGLFTVWGRMQCSDFMAEVQGGRQWGRALQAYAWCAFTRHLTTAVGEHQHVEIRGGGLGQTHAIAQGSETVPAPPHLAYRGHRDRIAKQRAGRLTAFRYLSW